MSHLALRLFIFMLFQKQRNEQTFLFFLLNQSWLSYSVSVAYSVDVYGSWDTSSITTRDASLRIVFLKKKKKKIQIFHFSG